MGEHSSAVVFDLDDTLIDTKRVLVPDALRRIAAIVGVPVERLDADAKTIDEVLGDLEPPPEQRAAAATVWNGPAVPPLDPVPGARETLAALKGKTRLVLLTRGNEVRQRRKLERCGLAAFFDDVVVRLNDGAGTKRDDLERILRDVAPERCAVVGDDPRDELKHAADLGCHVYDVAAIDLTDLPRLLTEQGIIA